MGSLVLAPLVLSVGLAVLPALDLRPRPADADCPSGRAVTAALRLRAAVGAEGTRADSPWVVTYGETAVSSPAGADAQTPGAQMPDAQAPPLVGCGGATKPTTPDPCTPAVVSSEPQTPGGPQCRCIIGFYWNGTACTSIGGCKCVGDCHRLYADEATCRADHAACGSGASASDGAIVWRTDASPGAAPDAPPAASSCDPLGGNSVVEYIAKLEDGRWIVVTRPRDNWRYEDFRLFLGTTPEQMIERPVGNVLRARDGGSTQITFELDGASAFAQFPPPNGATWLSPGTPRLEAGRPDHRSDGPRSERRRAIVQVFLPVAAASTHPFPRSNGSPMTGAAQLREPSTSAVVRGAASLACSAPPRMERAAGPFLGSRSPTPVALPPL